MRDGALSPRARRALFASLVALVVAALVLAFHAGISANPGSRLLTVFGLVEGGSLQADRWFDLTIDRAIVNGHVYSDKAPLSSFVVLPFYGLWRLFERGEQTARDLEVAVFLGDAVASAIPLGAFTWLLARRASRGMAPREAIAVALFATLGSPLLSYGGTYFGHVLSGALLVFAYDAAVQAKGRGDADRRALLSGILVGLAVLAELPMALGGAALALYWFVGEKGGARLARYVAGGLPSAVALGLYNASITGSPFDPPYHHLTSTFYTANPTTFDRHTLTVAFALLFGQYRGLFFYAPALLLLAPLAFARVPAARRRLLGGYAFVHFVFIASFWVWHGGWCIGPRHLTPLMMLFAYEGVDALASSSPFFRPVFFGLASAGVALNLVAVATNPFVDTTEHPFTDLYWPALARGEMTPHSFFADLGLSLGPATLAVWAAAFLLAALGLGQAARGGALAVDER
ncbi:MAG TPA: hypothetical protein VGI39_06320 [Polyangiaceae bacterium]|jgi:hypothetical protein